MNQKLRIASIVCAALLGSACSSMGTKPDFPVRFEGEPQFTNNPEDPIKPHSVKNTFEKADSNNKPPSTVGSIFNKKSYRGLFEDRKAMSAGDLLTIRIFERVTASQNNRTELSRESSASVSIPAIKGVFRSIAGEASGDQEFSGQGSTSASNQFVGEISVSVTEVLPNGNLVVAGEKQLATNNEIEYVRMTGVVDRDDILPGNVVLSTRVADAKIQYTGRGAIDAAQTMGWLSRVFLSILPY